MDFQSQHPVVEELLTNKYFGDTLLVCANGHLTDNKLAVGLLFPCLLTSDIFALPIENVLLVPDYTMEEIGREFEKLIIGGSCKPVPAPVIQNNSRTEPAQAQPEAVPSVASLQTERAEHDNSPAELVIDDTVDDTIENGFDENCDNIEIGDTDGETIEIFVNNNESPREEMEEMTVVETDDIPPDIQVELFSYQVEPDADKTTKSEVVQAEDDSNTTDGDLFDIVKSAERPELKNIPLKKVEVRVEKQRVWKQTKLKLQLEDDCGTVIENLPSLPDPEPAKEASPKKSPRASPKKDSPILEHRKPGRPRSKIVNTKCARKLDTDSNSVTRFKIKSAEWVANEKFKCDVCGKVLSCRGSFDRHKRMHTNTNPYKCSHCPKTFREACKKAVHERIHSGSKPYPCSQCSKSFRTATQRMVHQRSHTKEKPYPCTVCGKVFSQPYSVKVHMDKFHS